MSSSCTLGCLLRELKVLREKSKLCDALLREREIHRAMLQSKDHKIRELTQESNDQAEEIKKLKDENLELDRMCGLSEAMARNYYEELAIYHQLLNPELF